MLSLWLRRLSTDRIARLREKSRESAPLVVTGRRGNAEVLTAVDDAAERQPFAQPGAGASARHASRYRDSGRRCRGRCCLAQVNCRLVPALHAAGNAMHPTACCSTSAAARIFTAANTNWSPISAAGWKMPASAYSLAIAGTIGAAWAAAHMVNRPAIPCGEDACCLRHCLYPHCGFRRR
jgi:hypothetical protein